MLKIAIIGCGKIADQHVEHILHIPGCEIVGLADREELMARQLHERLNRPPYFREVADLLAKTKPDVVHITTPPQTHCAIARLCLQAGCNVYIEKPFAMNRQESEAVILLAERNGLKVTVGHNAQFSNAANRMRALVESGYLGGPPVHLESYYCYDLSDAGYAKVLLGNSYHWVRSLPGGLLQNTISHGISKISEFLPGPFPQVTAYGFTSPLLQSIGEADLKDELRVIVHDGPMTAYFTFSSQMRPSLHGLRLYGPRNGLILDEQQQTVIPVGGSHYKSYLEQFVPPFVHAAHYVRNSLGNIRKFVKADFQAGYGMRELIRRFYRSVTDGTAPPIPYSEILRTAWIMDEIFAQLAAPQNGAKSGRMGAEAAF